MGQKVNARYAVLSLLLESEKEGAHANLLLGGALNKYDYLPVQEKAFIKRLFEGTIERRIYLDYVLSQFLKMGMGKVKRQVKWILRMGAYQILYMDSVPDSAACNESVKLCKENRALVPLSGFVNGVLRSLAREKEKIIKADERTVPLDIYYSMPSYLEEHFSGLYSREDRKKLYQGFYEEKGVYLRLRDDLSAEQKEKTLNECREAGVKLIKSDLIDGAFEVTGISGLSALPGFTRGDFLVVDISSQLSVEIADIHPGDKVIDVCAAPGGKSLLALSKGATLCSRDLTEKKTDLIRENARRCGYGTDRITITERDARCMDEASISGADVVIADLPCSGFGIIGRKCDIKYHADAEKTMELVRIQKQILETVTAYVKPGGVLIYSTCTINPAENENQLPFIESLGFELESLNPYLPERIHSETTGRGYLQVLPGFGPGDGFFMARFRKKK